MHREQRQALRNLGDAVERRDPLRLLLLERELSARQEEVVDEVLAGRPELRQVGEHGLVRGDELSGAPEAEPAAALLRRECDRQVGADARERVERGLLRVVEPARERRDRNHERDAEREPEHGEDGPRLPPKQLVAKVGEVEHEPSKAGAAKSRLRPPTPVRSSHVRVPGQRDRSVTTDPQIAASRLDERPAAARAVAVPAMARCQTKVTEASRKRDGSAPRGWGSEAAKEGFRVGLRVPMTEASTEIETRGTKMRGLRIVALLSVLAELAAAAAFFIRPTR